MRTNILITTLILASLILHGCAAPLLLTGGAVGATLANDRRTAETIIDDQAIELRVRNSFAKDSLLSDNSHLSVTSFNRIVLLTGQVQQKQQYNRVVELIKKEQGLKRVHNEVQVAAPTPLSARTQDTWITTKVKKALLGLDQLNAIQVKVITENGTVYLMGLVTQAEGKAAANAAQRVSDVKGVIKVFDYLD